MAEIRIAKVTAQSNTPSSVRISRVQAQSGAAAPNAQVRIAGVRVQNAATGDLWVMQGGVWASRSVRYYASGSWHLLNAPAPPPPPSGNTLTVAQFNYYDGGTHTAGTSPWYQQIADVINGTGASVAVLCETNDPATTPPANRFTAVANVLGSQWVYTHQFTYSTNTFPLAIASKYPMVSFQSWDQSDLADMHKVMYEVGLNVNGTTVYVYGYHARPLSGATYKAVRIDEVNFLLGKMALRAGLPRVAVGDWNTNYPGEPGWDNGDVIQLWLNAGYVDVFREVNPTDPGFTNGVTQTDRIDYTMRASDAGMTSKASRVYSTWPAGATKFPSDHYALVSTVTI